MIIKQRRLNMQDQSPTSIDELIEQINDIYLALDENWNITRFNTQAKQVFAVDANANLYGNLWERLPEVAHSFSAAFKKAFGQNCIDRFDAFYPPTNQWFEACTVPVADGGLEVFFHDITGYKQIEKILRNQNAYLIAIVDRLPHGVVSIDHLGSIHTFNPAAEALFGYKAVDIIGKNISLLVTQTDQTNHDDFLENWQQTDSSKVIGQNRVVIGKKLNGQTFHAEITINELTIHDKRHFVSVIHDISDRQKATAGLLQHREQLSQLVENRTKDLAFARDRALEANKAKSAFLANMSHELRTPLNAIIGYSEMIEEETADIDHDTLSLDIRKIRSAGKHLLSLINGVLDLSKIEAGRMESFIESFHLLSVTEDVTSSIDSLVQQNNNKIYLKMDDDVGDIDSDVTKVRQILFNLISNANKFTKNGTITIRLSRNIDSGNDWVILQVSDTGIGMDGSQIENLFQPFMQADGSTSRKYGGTGLGLAITDRLCTLLGGTVTVSSIPNEGSVFTVKLPAKSTAVDPQQPCWFSVGPKVNPKLIRFGNADDIIDTRRKKISTVLVIDDDANIRDLMERFLSREGFYAYTAKNAEEGLALAKEFKPDIITLDVMMPEKDGWWVLSQLKNDPELSQIPTVMMTLVEDKELGYALGADDYLNKPVDKTLLLKTISKYVRTKETLTAFVIQPDQQSSSMIQSTLASKKIQVTHFDKNDAAFDALLVVQPDFIVVELVTPTNDSVQFIDKLKKHPNWKDISIFVTTDGELSETETFDLTQNLTHLLHSNDKSGEAFLTDLKAQLTNCVRNKNRT